MSNHGDAFMRMLYRSDDGSEEEWIWNGRDGVTPFCVQSRSGKEMTHVEWNRDQYLPDYKPQPGERYFVTLTYEKAREYAERQADRILKDPKLRKDAGPKSALVLHIIDSFRIGESPDIATVEERDALLRLHDNPSEALHGWRLTLRESEEALRELESIGVPCTDCGKRITNVSEVVVKGDRAMHFNCPATERHGELAAALREPEITTDGIECRVCGDVLYLSKDDPAHPSYDHDFDSTDAKPLSAAELAAIRARAEKATPGPWISVSDCDKAAIIARGERGRAIIVESENHHAPEGFGQKRGGVARSWNADFIAHARDDIPRLLATIDALDAELQQLGDGVNPALERFRLRQTIDSLTARSSEITDEAVAAAAFAYTDRCDTTDHISRHFIAGVEWALAATAAEATRGET